MTIADVKLDLAKVKVPIYNLATREDHIAPAQSVFVGSKFFGGPVKYVLAGSGHIAGVVNPPAQAEVSVLDRRQGRRRHAGKLDRQGQGKSRLVVAGLARLDQRAGRRDRARAHARRRQAQTHRGRAGQLRQGPRLTGTLMACGVAATFGQRSAPPPDD